MLPVDCCVVLNTNKEMQCFMYRWSEGFNPYNPCVCYCQTRRTYLRFCRQLYFQDGDMIEGPIMGVC